MVPTEVQGELKHLYVAAGELLRHFWSCFPVNTLFLEEKVTDIHFVSIIPVTHIFDYTRKSSLYLMYILCNFSK